MLIFASTRDRQEETHVNKFAFFVQLQFSPIFTNFAPFSSISANSLKEQTIFTNFLKESISFHHLSSLFTTSRQFSANFCQFLAIFINFGQFLAISTNFSQFRPISANFGQFRLISANSLKETGNSLKKTSNLFPPVVSEFVYRGWKSLRMRIFPELKFKIPSWNCRFKNFSAENTASHLPPLCTFAVLPAARKIFSTSVAVHILCAASKQHRRYHGIQFRWSLLLCTSSVLPARQAHQTFSQYAVGACCAHSLRCQHTSRPHS